MCSDGWYVHRPRARSAAPRASRRARRARRAHRRARRAPRVTPCALRAPSHTVLRISYHCAPRSPRGARSQENNFTFGVSRPILKRRGSGGGARTARIRRPAVEFLQHNWSVEVALKTWTDKVRGRAPAAGGILTPSVASMPPAAGALPLGPVFALRAAVLPFSMLPAGRERGSGKYMLAPDALSLPCTCLHVACSARIAKTGVQGGSAPLPNP